MRLIDITGVTDYGVSLEAILAGREQVSPQGARLDVATDGDRRFALFADGVRIDP